MTEASAHDAVRRLALLKRQARIVSARENMLAFGHFMMPDTENPDDAERSEYQESAPARCLCDLLEQLESGKKKRVAVSMPPQMGKTINLSTFGVAWIWGRNPRARIVVASYNETRAQELGKDLLDLLGKAQYQQVFPDLQLDPSAKSRASIQNTKGGKVKFVGIGGSITGNTADYFFIDDPIKGEDDGSDLTPQALEQLWGWFFKVAFSRGSTKTRILITHTRWAEDDLIGRLCDPNHPERDKRFKHIADKWFYLNLPAVVTDPELAKLLRLELKKPEDDDVRRAFGVKPMSSLWPENKDLSFYAEWKQGDARSFSALAMGNPAPEDGAYFSKDMIAEYDSVSVLPRELRIYGASDHAVSTKQGRDYTVIGCVGVDENDNIWVLPNLVWDRMETDRTVDELLEKMRDKTWKPDVWWLENENISKAFGPFLIKRMHEERVYCLLDGIRPASDKKTRARSIQGRMAMRKVFFPNFAPWWPDAKAQILRFPHAAHDDFVDFLSLVGMGLTKQYPAEVANKRDDKVVHVGSIEWILAQTNKKEARDKLTAARRGW